MSELTLVLEASTPDGSVALIAGDRLVADARVAMRAREGEQLLPAVVALLRAAGRSTTDLTRIVCSAGPGGFTGLRIAAAIGKGLAESLGVALWSHSSLALLAVAAFRGASVATGGVTASRDDGEVLAILDAMRDEWYVQCFARAANGACAVDARTGVLRLSRPDIVALAAERGAMVAGVGGGSFSGGADAVPEARDVVSLEDGALLQPVDLAGWEPDYGRLAEAQVKWEATHGRALGRSA